MAFAVASELIALIVYPIKYIEELEEAPGPESQNSDWEFGWAYGIGWGAAIFMFGGAILVLLDKETDEVTPASRDPYTSIYLLLSWEKGRVSLLLSFSKFLDADSPDRFS